MTIEDDVQDLEVLLSMKPAELAPIMLKHAFRSADQRASKVFHPYGLCQELRGMNQSQPSGFAFRRSREQEVEQALIEALHWLETHGLVMPNIAEAQHGGHYRVTRLGREVANHGNFEHFRRATAFPKAMLHPAIADKVWLLVVQGNLQEAVFAAFLAFEERVRDAGGFTKDDYGAGMLAKAFKPDTGPLARSTDTMSEQEGLLKLVLGAYSSYRNPHSHRTVQVSETLEAQEMILLASHLLRIVDSRRL